MNNAGPPWEPGVAGVIDLYLVTCNLTPMLHFVDTISGRKGPVCSCEYQVRARQSIKSML